MIGGDKPPVTALRRHRLFGLRSLLVVVAAFGGLARAGMRGVVSESAVDQIRLGTTKKQNVVRAGESLGLGSHSRRASVAEFETLDFSA